MEDRWRPSLSARQVRGEPNLFCFSEAREIERHQGPKRRNGSASVSYRPISSILCLEPSKTTYTLFDQRSGQLTCAIQSGWECAKPAPGLTRCCSRAGSGSNGAVILPGPPAAAGAGSENPVAPRLSTPRLQPLRKWLLPGWSCCWWSTIVPNAHLVVFSR